MTVQSGPAEAETAGPANVSAMLSLFKCMDDRSRKLNFDTPAERFHQYVASTPD